MKQKHFFKNQGSLQRKAIASGLTATFVAGTVSNFAGATELINPVNINIDFKEKSPEEIQGIMSKEGIELKSIKFEEGEDFSQNIFKALDDENFKARITSFDRVWGLNKAWVVSVDKMLQKVFKLNEQQIAELKKKLGSNFPKVGDLYFFSATYSKVDGNSNLAGFMIKFYEYFSYIHTTYNAGDVLCNAMKVYCKEVVEAIEIIKEEKGDGEGINGEEKNKDEPSIDNVFKKALGKLEIDKKQNKKKKIVIGLVASVVVLAILAVIITVAFKLNNNANNQNSDKTDGKPDGGNGSTNPNNNNPKPTKDEEQQGTKQTGSSSVLPQVLKYGGAAVGTGTAIAGGITAVRLGKKSDDKEAGANNKTSYAYINSDKVRAANAENERKDDENKGNENKDDNKDNSEDNNKDETSGTNEDSGTAQ